MAFNLPANRAASTGFAAALTHHMNQTFSYMAAGVGVSGIVAYLTMQSPALLNLAVQGGLVWFMVLLGLAFFLHKLIFSLQPAAGLAVFAGYSAFMGFVFAPLVAMYTGASVASAFAVAAIMFAGTAAYGALTKRSLSGWGTFLSMGVWGLLGAVVVTMVMGLFGMQVGFMQTAINLIAVPLFAAMTAWQVNEMRDTFAAYGQDELMRSRLAVLQAVGLYVNFINMFISLLQLLGQQRQ
ncbi:MAG: Bax inhibitor-1/YccA family protein [Alphaproteobacteria bacterium]|jgi:FtsH-binding integral membrane protein|nr:Bax inhibitor-1/YccA family protein [Alphaproteobacteria bacterium]